MKTNLKSIRMSNNLETKTVADKFGVSLRTYQNYENGTTEMPYSLLISFADFFNCSVDYLLGHTTSGIIHLDSLTPGQAKLVEIIKQLNPDQTLEAIGYFSHMLNVPFNHIKPERPW